MAISNSYVSLPEGKLGECPNLFTCGPCCRLEPVKVNGKQSCADAVLMSLGSTNGRESEILDPTTKRWIFNRNLIRNENVPNFWLGGSLWHHFWSFNDVSVVASEALDSQRIMLKDALSQVVAFDNLSSPSRFDAASSRRGSFSGHERDSKLSHLESHGETSSSSFSSSSLLLIIVVVVIDISIHFRCHCHHI